MYPDHPVRMSWDQVVPRLNDAGKDLLMVSGYSHRGRITLWLYQSTWYAKVHATPKCMLHQNVRYTRAHATPELVLVYQSYNCPSLWFSYNRLLFWIAANICLFHARTGLFYLVDLLSLNWASFGAVRVEHYVRCSHLEQEPTWPGL